MNFIPRSQFVNTKGILETRPTNLPSVMSNRQLLRSIGVCTDDKLRAAKCNVLSVCSITSRCSRKEPALLPRTLFSRRNVDQTRQVSLNKVIIIKAVETELKAYVVL